MMDEHCKELMEKFSEYIDGEACDEDCRKILSHLEQCERCRRCLETLRLTRDLLKKMPAPELPPEIKERLRDCLKNEEADQEP